MLSFGKFDKYIYLKELKEMSNESKFYLQFVADMKPAVLAMLKLIDK